VALDYLAGLLIVGQRLRDAGSCADTYQYGCSPDRHGDRYAAPANAHLYDYAKCNPNGDTHPDCTAHSFADRREHPLADA